MTTTTTITATTENADFIIFATSGLCDANPMSARAKKWTFLNYGGGCFIRIDRRFSEISELVAEIEAVGFTVKVEGREFLNVSA